MNINTLLLLKSKTISAITENKKYILGITLIVLAVVSGLLTWRTPEQVEPSIYRVPVFLGETITEIAKKTACPIAIIKIDETSDAFVLSKKPLIMEYADAKHGFVLPPTHFLSVTSEHRNVIDIGVSPQLHSLNLKESIALLQRLELIFAKAGWRPDSNRTHLKMADLPGLYQNPNIVGYEIQTWQEGTKQLVLTIERKKRATTAQQVDTKFLVHIHLSDHSFL